MCPHVRPNHCSGDAGPLALLPDLDWDGASRSALLLQMYSEVVRLHAVCAAIHPGITPLIDQASQPSTAAALGSSGGAAGQGQDSGGGEVEGGEGAVLRCCGGGYLAAALAVPDRTESAAKVERSLAKLQRRRPGVDALAAVAEVALAAAAGRRQAGGGLAAAAGQAVAGTVTWSVGASRQRRVGMQTCRNQPCT